MSNGPRVPGGNPADPFPIVNAALDVYSHQEVYAINPAQPQLLTFYYLGGAWGGFPITNGNVALIDDAENYIVVERSTGVLSVSTSATNWNNLSAYARVFHITTADGERDEVRDYRAGAGGVHGGSVAPGGSGSTALCIAIGDETTAITAGVAKVTFRMPFAMTSVSVRASLTAAQETNGGGGILTFDINEGGASILSTKLTIDNTERTSTTAVAQPVVSDGALADDAEITIDVDQVGDGTAAGGKIYIIGTPS